DLAAPADERGQIANDHAGAAADLEDTITKPDRDESQEAPAQPGLGRRPSAPLEPGGHLLDVRLGVGVAPRIGRTAGRAGAARRRGGLRAVRSHAGGIRGPGRPGPAARREPGALLAAEVAHAAGIRAAYRARLHDVRLAHRVLDELVADGGRYGPCGATKPAQRREGESDRENREDEKRQQPHEISGRA